ncbi:MAG: metallophosphoesterase [Bryobacterales bacterium]|jgi:3',5'-cyclic AMP phosphodiesterase CpdA|nr:metallophosphoesterase [Bryobacterales bacterium]
MPYLTLPRRREFLATASAAGLLLSQGARSAAAQQGRARWAFFSDTHIAADRANTYRGFKPYEQLAKVAPAVAASGVTGAIIDGDLARLTGEPGDYQNFLQLLAPVAAKMPIAMALGNHDNRKNFQAAIGKHPGEVQAVRDRHVLAVPAGPVRLLVLDSLMMPDFTPGFLGKEQRTWLERYLGASDETPTLVFVHHTPGDNDGELLDAERLLRILKASRKVKALIYGHSHRYRFDVLDGLHCINLPAVGYNFNDAEPTGWTEVELSAEGADFKLHAMGGNLQGDGKVTSIAWRG